MSDQPKPRRFTVLHHTGVDEPHYDLLFETSDTSQLTTFRLPAWPVFERLPARKLRDHRRAYLDYVGPVSSDRGRVDRVDEGRILLTQDGGGYSLRYDDTRPFARLEPLPDAEPDEWLFIPQR